MMTIRNGLNRSQVLWAVLALLALAFAATAAMAAPAESKPAKGDKGDWKNLQLVYTTDIKGKIEPCG